MIDVVFPLHDPKGIYILTESVAIYSLLKNTNNDITIHVIHDETVTEDNLEVLHNMVVSRFHKNFNHIEIDTHNWNIDPNIFGDFTIGTLLRLKIPELFKNFDKILYLDADIIVETDIDEIWKIDISDYYVAACKDEVLAYADNGSIIIEEGIVKKDLYFNAGVMLMNLKKINKEFDLFFLCVDYFKKKKKLSYADQDVLNVLFRNKVYYLDNSFNMFTSCLREKKYIPKRGIFHFAGDKPQMVQMKSFDLLYYEYLIETEKGRKMMISSIGEGAKCIEKQIKCYQAIIKALSSNPKIVLWGVKAKARASIEKFIDLKQCDYYVDSNQELWETTIGYGIKIKNPNELTKEDKKNIIVIVLSSVYYNEISKILTDWGFENGINFFNGSELLLPNQWR